MMWSVCSITAFATFEGVLMFRRLATDPHRRVGPFTIDGDPIKAAALSRARPTLCIHQLICPACPAISSGNERPMPSHHPAAALVASERLQLRARERPRL
jgi:hypothetical protein